MTIEIESEVIVCAKYANRLVLCSTYHILTDDSLQSADKYQQERCAKPSKFTAASHGFPCHSTAFLLLIWRAVQIALVKTK